MYRHKRLAQKRINQLQLLKTVESWSKEPHEFSDEVKDAMADLIESNEELDITDFTFNPHNFEKEEQIRQDEMEMQDKESTLFAFSTVLEEDERKDISAITGLSIRREIPDEENSEDWTEEEMEKVMDYFEEALQNLVEHPRDVMRD